jgi:2-polyprenyl-3-methyl-5-hydroxy-6-metoxy-1,4-benzoquinol methylase
MKIAENKCKSLKEVRILDVGCGHGTWINYLLEHATQPGILKIKGIDISEKRIALARKMLASHPNVSLELMDFAKITASEKYDVVFFAEVFQYIDEREYFGVFRKIFQILMKGGYCVIIDKEKFSIAALERKARQILGKMGLASEIYQYTSYPSFRYLSRLSEEASLRIENKVKRKNFSSLVIMKP